MLAHACAVEKVYVNADNRDNNDWKYPPSGYRKMTCVEAKYYEVGIYVWGTQSSHQEFCKLDDMRA